jgi:hypothetical protein
MSNRWRDSRWGCGNSVRRCGCARRRTRSSRRCWRVSACRWCRSARGCGRWSPAGARDVAEKLGIRYVYACFHIFGLPSRHFSPGARPGKPSPQEETDNRALWEQDAQRVNALYGEALNSHRAAIGLPPVDNVRDYVFTDQPWLAADATLCPSQGMTDLDIVQTGAWILPDDRPLPQELEAFLDASAPPVYVGLGSMAAHALKDIARVAIEASRAHGRRVLLARGWPARPRWWSPRSRTRRTGPPEWPSWASARLTTARLRPSTWRRGGAPPIDDLRVPTAGE